jgi:endonuclease III
MQQVAELELFYGLLPSPPRDPFMLFVWDVLSMQTPPAKRDAGFGALKRARLLTPDAVSRAPKARLEAALAVSGPNAEQRLRALCTGADVFRRSPALPAAIRGPLAAARRALKQISHLGDAGAHRMLLFAADRPILPVDSRVHRVGVRLGYASDDSSMRKSARRLRRTLTAQLPCRDLDVFRRTFVYLSHHGAVTCTEADPHCIVCPLLSECPEGQARFKI